MAFAAAARAYSRAGLRDLPTSRAARGGDDVCEAGPCANAGARRQSAQMAYRGVVEIRAHGGPGDAAPRRSRASDSLATASNAAQSSGGLPLSSILRNTA